MSSIWTAVDDESWVMQRARRVYSVGKDPDGTWWMEMFTLGRVRDAVRISGCRSAAEAKAEAVRIEREARK